MPFGIFGDFIPNPGRDIINYGAIWNDWQCQELLAFFKKVVQEVLSRHDQWKFFTADDCLIQVLGKDELGRIVGKELAASSIVNKIRYEVEQITVESFLQLRDTLEFFKDKPDKLTALYHCINNSRSLTSMPFVLGDNNEFYSPGQLMMLGINLDAIPDFIRVVVPASKKLLHPEITRDSAVVEKLKSYGVEVINEQTLTKDVERLVDKITRADMLVSQYVLFRHAFEVYRL